MTTAEEITLLETAYRKWVEAGCPQAYTVNGRAVTKADMLRIRERIDHLQIQQQRATDGIFTVSQFRDPE